METLKQRSRALLELRRRKFEKLLSISDDALFLRMVWAVVALQSGNASEASLYLRFPKEAATEDITSKLKVHPWILETIVNELLTVSKRRLPKDRLRSLDCSQFATIATLVNLNNAIEDIEFSLVKGRNIWNEMYRLTQRQFAWQRGFVNYQTFYHYSFLYGFDAAKDAFSGKHGISISDFVLTCFALYAHHATNPFISRHVDMRVIGVTPEMLDSTLKVVSLPHPAAREAARGLRKNGRDRAYKVSVLRLWPSILFGAGDSFIAPIRELLVYRATEGIFYDLVGFGGDLRRQLGSRFESLVEKILSFYLPDSELRGEFKYSGRFDSPDFLLSQDKLFCVIECKSKRMSIAERYSDDPLHATESAYDEMVKAVVQLWRFFFHLRTGAAKVGKPVCENAVGMVLTLDDWLHMGDNLRQDVLDRAESIVEQKCPGIIPEDKKSVIFVSLRTLENVLMLSSLEQFRTTLRFATLEKYAGWSVGGVYTDIYKDQTNKRIFPYATEMAEVLPWWNIFEKLRINPEGT